MNLLFISKVLHVVLVLLLIPLVMIQSKGVGLSSTFGGVGGYYRTRRGVEKVVFVVTIIIVIAFVFNSLLIVLLS